MVPSAKPKTVFLMIPLVFFLPLLFAPCSSLSNHPIRPKKHRLWNREPDLLCCLKIDNHLELRRSLDGNVSGLGAFEYLVHVTRCAPIRLGKARTVGHEQARVGILLQSTYRRQAALERKIRDQSAVCSKHWIGQNVQRPCALFGYRCETALDLVWISRLHLLKTYIQHSSRGLDPLQL